MNDTPLTQADAPCRRDEDCDVDPTTNLCRKCGVEHGAPCPECGGRGYHKDDCSSAIAEDEVERAPLTPQRVAAYLHEVACPYCGSVDISNRSDLDAEGGSAWMSVECNSCKRDWTEEYELIGISENTGHITTTIRAPKTGLAAITDSQVTMINTLARDTQERIRAAGFASYAHDDLRAIVFACVAEMKARGMYED